MTDSLTSRIEERRRALAGLIRRRDDITRQIQTAEIELRAYEDAMSLVSDRKPVKEDHSQPSLPNGSISAPTASASGIEYAAARMSKQWRLIFTEMKNRRPIPITIAQMRALAEQHNITVNDQSMRSALHKFSERGWLDRIKMGQYTITDTGIRALDVKAGLGEIPSLLSEGKEQRD